MPRLHALGHMRAAQVGIDGAAALAEGAVVMEGGDVGDGRGGVGRLMAAKLLGSVREGVWERPPRCGM